MSDEMFVDFINSEMYDGHGELKDRLADPRWIRAFRAKWGTDGKRRDIEAEHEAYFTAQRSPVERGPRPRDCWEPATLTTLLELRTLLRRIAETVSAGETVRTSDARELDGYLRSASFHNRLRRTPDGFTIEPAPSGDDPAQLTGAIAFSAARFLAEGPLDRLKTCSNHGCRWVFHDETRNRSRRWCNSDLCGNLFKVRAYRDRKRTSARHG